MPRLSTLALCSYSVVAVWLSDTGTGSLHLDYKNLKTKFHVKFESCSGTSSTIPRRASCTAHLSSSSPPVSYAKVSVCVFVFFFFSAYFGGVLGEGR